MRPRLEQLLPKIQNQSFLCYEVNVPAFEFFCHYHPEYELTCIVKGKGKRLVGDRFEKFQDGDWVLLGSNLPHTWVSDKNSKENCQAIVIQFTQVFIEKLCEFPELKGLEKLLVRAGRGLELGSAKNKEYVLLLKRMLVSSDMMRFTLLLQLLEQVLQKKSLPLASAKYKPIKGNENQLRINKVFQYVEKEFREKVSLKKAAAIIHLSETAFCKFFKRASGKTFSDYTNEIRIAYACQLLLETDKSIREVALDSGFDSLTYFNRVFLKKKKIRPGEFRRIVIF
ncbi:MAG: helix-turn-helix domain-containing protein [Terrimonas sp.]|nr:helix-turn-helix domain-containing protein [Terrimonas sp.]